MDSLIGLGPESEDMLREPIDVTYHGVRKLTSKFAVGAAGMKPTEYTGL